MDHSFLNQSQTAPEGIPQKILDAIQNDSGIGDVIIDLTDRSPIAISYPILWLSVGLLGVVVGIYVFRVFKQVSWSPEKRIKKTKFDKFLKIQSLAKEASESKPSERSTAVTTTRNIASRLEPAKKIELPLSHEVEGVLHLIESAEIKASISLESIGPEAEGALRLSVDADLIFDSEDFDHLTTKGSPRAPK